MATFKLSIADPKQGKTYKKEVKEEEAKPFLGLNIGETVKGEVMGMTGFEFKMSGGSDHCGFPMRSGIQGNRKKVTVLGGVGFSGGEKGIAKSKTVCGHKVHDKISQINLTMIKAGSTSLPKALGLEEEKAEEKKPEEKPKEEKPAEAPKAEKPKEVEKQAEASKEKKAEEKPKEEKKPEAKEEKKAEKEETPKAEDKPKEAPEKKPETKEDAK